MNPITLIARTLSIGALSLGAAMIYQPAAAQGAPQVVALVKIDPTTVATGYRASKILGAAVINEAKESIGKIDDLIVSEDGKTPFAVVSVGGFLGMGEHLIAIPYASFKMVDGKITLPGATKEELKGLTPFFYAKL
jgi:hypothetical protein